MDYNETVAVFESKHIRRYYDSVNEVWYFALVDIVAALTDSANATDYLKKIRKRDEELHFYLGTNCPQVEMQTESGKKRKTLAGSTAGISISPIYSFAQSRALQTMACQGGL
ncbi:MAG: hypothetical protein M0R39_00395 [Prolixibacteraceae bacterium]|nr:hypothetical protein [Prolixibacteraceae bacterium]